MSYGSSSMDGNNFNDEIFFYIRRITKSTEKRETLVFQ